ncbi:MAG: NUDIX domain-containing protein [Clostridia bacterium]|nr:NUDIX domain-containing protein [Clostridia bacterium]
MIVQKAGTILLNLETKQIGLVYRQKKDDYSFPKGHLEKGETLQECAVRETEEETLRANHLYSEKEVDTLRYLTPAGEDVESHVYIAIDDGPTNKNIPLKDREELRWVAMAEVENILSYNDLKELWRKVLPLVEKIFSGNTLS